MCECDIHSRSRDTFLASHNCIPQQWQHGIHSLRNALRKCAKFQLCSHVCCLSQCDFFSMPAFALVACCNTQQLTASACEGRQIRRAQTQTLCLRLRRTRTIFFSLFVFAIPVFAFGVSHHTHTHTHPRTHKLTPHATRTGNTHHHASIVPRSQGPIPTCTHAHG